MKVFYSLFTMAFILSCNQPGKKETDFDIEAVKTHIAEMNKTYGERFITNDTAFYNSRYCKDAAVYSPGIPRLRAEILLLISFTKTAQIPKQK